MIELPESVKSQGDRDAENRARQIVQWSIDVMKNSGTLTLQQAYEAVTSVYASAKTEVLK